ncbi:MAG TPA: sugar phosphate isomerase/epimerase [Acidobacteriaceae bacterium]
MKGAAACAAMLEARPAFGNPLGLPIGLQLYSVREYLPKDYEGTLKRLGEMGYQEVEAAGFFTHSATDVKQAMADAGLRCVSAHYALADLKPKLDEIIQYGKDLGLSYIICSAPMMRDPNRAKGLSWNATMEAVTLDDWKWNAEQFNSIGEKIHAAGIQFGYHNHFVEFHRKEGGARPYDVILKNTDPKIVTMEMDVGWVVIGGAKPEEYLTKYPTRFTQLHVKEFQLANWTPGEEPISTEMNQGSLDYKSIFAATKHAGIRHIYVEQEAFPDMEPFAALKVDADWLKAFPG